MIKSLIISVLLMLGFATVSLGQVDWYAEYDNTYICFDYKIHVYIGHDTSTGMVDLPPEN